MSDLKYRIHEMYSHCGLTVPIIMATSPMVGAFLAPILAHAKDINAKTITEAKEDAKELAFGKKPLKGLINHHVDSLSQNLKGGHGPFNRVPGGNNLTLLQSSWRLMSREEQRRRQINPGNADPTVFYSQIIFREADQVFRRRIHALFKSRVKYHDRIEVTDHVCCWPNKRFVVLSEKPTRILVNNNRQLHSTEKLAVRFSDGWGIAAINGIAIPPVYVHKHDMLTLEVINKTNNVEVKRALIELFGFDRFLKESNAALLHEDEDRVGKPRRLWRLIDQPANQLWRDRDQINLLQVTNSTPEPDGTYKDYYLQVPGDVDSINRALMWMLDEQFRYGADALIET